MFKKGDTLIEVALAVGIFSMVAIAVASVLSGSTSGAQTALETTITREEIDAQAEAIRFIQAGYAVNRNDTENNKFYKLWHAITDKAINLSSTSGLDPEEFLNYAPTSCQTLYDNSSINYAFIINPRALGDYTANANSTVSPVNTTDSANPGNSVVIGYNANPSTGRILQPATIYPRLIYSGSTASSNTTQQDALINDNANSSLYRAEGIYVIAVKDNSTTGLNLKDGRYDASTAAFYDFYIRSCWYGTDSDQPSTISTVIRLYDPDISKR